MKRLGLICAALALCACGDPRSPFLGMYEGNATFVANWTGQPSTTEQYTDQVHVAPSKDGEHLYLSQLCGLPATVDRADRLELGAVTCVQQGGGCTFTWNVTGGSATLEGALFTLQYAAALVEDCAAGSHSATTNTTIVATRK
jgi:hypothetical protein